MSSLVRRVGAEADKWVAEILPHLAQIADDNEVPDIAARQTIANFLYAHTEWTFARCWQTALRLRIHGQTILMSAPDEASA